MSIQEEEKNIFLQELENESISEDIPVKKGTKNRKKISGTAIFAATFVFFLFIVILLIFVLGLSGSGNPFFTSFGIEPYEVKSFLKELVNNTFLVFIILLLLSTAIGIFRGYSLAKEEKKKRRGSFIFGAVAGGLVFVSVLAWGGALAFIENFVIEEIQREKIELMGFEDGRDIVAPLDIEFSAVEIAKKLQKKGLKPEKFRWSKDDGKNYTKFNLDESITLQFFKKGKQKILLDVELKDGEVRSYERSFTVDSATFSVDQKNILAKKKVSFSAKNLISNGKKFQWDFDGDEIYDRTTKTPSINHTFLRPGKFTVHLRVEKNDDSVEEFSREILVKAEAGKSIIADIVMNKEPKGKAPLEIEFSAENSYTQEGEIEKYFWKIGKKKIGSAKISKQGVLVTHEFSQAGIYLVELEVQNEFGESDVSSTQIIVEKGNSAPKAVITTKPSLNKKSNRVEGNIPFELNFSAEKSTDADENITSYNWKIENKNEVIQEFEGSQGTYIFRSPGEYQVTLEIIDSEGESDTKNIKIFTIEPPVSAVIKASPKTGTVPLIVEFSGSESSCKTQGCEILSFEWNFDDGTPIKPTGAHISHQFSKTGTFAVEMTAITNTGERSSSIQHITVTEPAFSACFTLSRISGPAPLAVRFDANSCSKGDIVKYAWDFGDGYISSQRKPKHTYEKEGVYTAKLKIFDKDGRVSRAENIVTVKRTE